MIQKKIALLGAPGVGKTSLVRRFVESIFDEKYLTTIGVKVDKKSIQVRGQDVLLMLWDVAGAEENFSVPSSYVRGSAGYLLVVDGTRPETVERGLDIIEQLRRDVGDLPFVLVLNKIDLVDAWRVQDADLEPITALGAPTIRSSALTGEGVEDAFHRLAESIVS
ncbi:MAG: Rab family GTPase [Gemmatimonadota bacterium]